MALWISKLLALLAILAIYSFVASDETSTQPFNFGGRKTSFLAELFPVSFHIALHGLSRCHGFISRQPKTCNLTQRVKQCSPASVGSDANGKIALQRNLRKWNDVIAGRQSPALAVPEETVISEMVIVVVAENVEYHPLPQLPRIFPRSRPEEPQLLREAAIALVR